VKTTIRILTASAVTEVVAKRARKRRSSRGHRQGEMLIDFECLK